MIANRTIYVVAPCWCRIAQNTFFLYMKKQLTHTRQTVHDQHVNAVGNLVIGDTKIHGYMAQFLDASIPKL